MLYNDFENMIRPFLNIRWTSFLYTRKAIEVTINLAVQQIYNEYRWSFLFHTILIKDTDWVQWQYGWEYEPVDLIKYPVEVRMNDEILDPAKSLNDFGIEGERRNFLFLDGKLIVKHKYDAKFSYFRQYRFIPYETWLPEDRTQDIQLPDSFIPALYYLVLSQLDMLYVQQGEWQVVNNYSKYANEIDKLKLDDLPWATSFYWANPQ